MAARNDNTDDKADTNRLEADIQQLKVDLKRLNDTLVGIGKESLDAVQSESAARLTALRREADEIAQKLKGKGESQYAAIEAQVQEKPLMALLAAFGLGMVISRLIDRR